MKRTIAQSFQTDREPPEKNPPPVIPPAGPWPLPVDDPPETPADPTPYVVTDPSGVARASRLDRIARRAYQIHETRGGGPERSLSDWLQAEREIDLTD